VRAGEANSPPRPRLFRIHNMQRAVPECKLQEYCELLCLHQCCINPSFVHDQREYSAPYVGSNDATECTSRQELLALGTRDRVTPGRANAGMFCWAHSSKHHFFACAQVGAASRRSPGECALDCGPAGVG